MEVMGLPLKKQVLERMRLPVVPEKTEETTFKNLRAGDEFYIIGDSNNLKRMKVQLSLEGMSVSVVVSEGAFKGQVLPLKDDIAVLKVIK
ncbi:MAG: hypothetical protein AAB758_00700 [Patescibacteria group bacterium]